METMDTRGEPADNWYFAKGIFAIHAIMAANTLPGGCDRESVRHFVGNQGDVVTKGHSLHDKHNLHIEVSGNVDRNKVCRWGISSCKSKRTRHCTVSRKSP
jgi:hypothetical protein